jgi:trimeric autotransporter adhesin
MSDPRNRSKMILIRALAGFAVLSIAKAQCNLQWAGVGAMPGVNGIVYATVMHDPDGAGPAPARLVIGGDFTVAGNVTANRVAAWDPATGAWSALGAGMAGMVGTTTPVVRSLAVLPNGDLVAGGSFTQAGNVAARDVARWNGAAWSGLAAGLNLQVDALAVLPNGDLAAGGRFSASGATSLARIARWNGVSWSSIGTGAPSSNDEVMALTVLPNGDLVAGGAFFSMGGVGGTANLARWNGSAWINFGSGPGGPVRALATMSNGDLAVGGVFTTAGGTPANRIARWNGAAWAAFGTGVSGSASPSVLALLQLPNGDLVAGGSFTAAGGIAASNVARWNGSAWAPFGAGTGEFVLALTLLANGDWIAGGNFTSAGGVAADHLASWNGTAWSAVSASTEVRGMVNVAVSRPDGAIVVGGQFVQAGGVAANRVARFDGATWSPLGAGVSGGAIGTVYSMANLPNGDLVVGGNFATAGGVPASSIARWNGVAWSALGSGVSSNFLTSVFAMVVLPNGDLIVGGEFTFAGGVVANRIARWNGSAWSSFGGSGTSGTIYAMSVLPNGDLVVGGAFTSAGGVAVNNLARWDGTTWSALGAGVDTAVYALTALPDGSVVAGGPFVTAGGAPANAVALWNGSTWSPLGSGMNGSNSAGAVLGLHTLPDGDVLAVGIFASAGGVAAPSVARWSGSAWSAIGSGIQSNPGYVTDDRVVCLCALPDGDILVGGSFTIAGGQAAPNLARLHSPCPATATAYGAGCIGSNGPLVLSATELPWLGGQFRSVTTGIGANSLAFSLLGFSVPGVPLSTLHPAGVAGCDLLASGEAVLLLMPGGGVATAAFPLASAPGYLGLQVRHQTIELEPSSGNVAAVRSSNGLLLTFGVF